MTLPQNRQPTSRLIWMDGLRGVAAVAVVFGHYFWSLLNFPGQIYFDPGVFGVGVFFLISGYIIPQSIRPHDPQPLLRFVCSRIFRLYPIYWVSLLIGVFIYQTRPAQMLINATMTQRFLGFHDVIGVYWTLQVELVFYGFIILTVITGAFNRVSIVVLSTSISALLSVALGFIRFYLQYKSPSALPIGMTIILMGNLYSLYRLDAVRRFLFYKIALCVCACLVLSFYLSYGQDWGYNENPLRFISSYGAATAFFFGASKHEYRWPRAFIGLGLISYPVYLIHQPLQRIVADILKGPPELVTNFVTFFIVIFLAVLLHLALERPSIQLGRWLIKDQRSRRIVTGPQKEAVADVSD